MRHLLQYKALIFLVTLCFKIDCSAAVASHAGVQFIDLLREADPSFDLVKERNHHFAGKLVIPVKTAIDQKMANIFGLGSNGCPWEMLKKYSETEEQIGPRLDRVVIRGKHPGKPLILFSVHGTWSDADNFGKDSWAAPLTVFVRHCARMLAYVYDCPVHLYTFGWDGYNQREVRRRAADDMTQAVLQAVDVCGGKDAITALWTIGHSHGGNVICGAANNLFIGHEIAMQQAVLIGTPEIESYGTPVDAQHFGIEHLCCLYSTDDITGLLGSLTNWRTLGSQERKLGAIFRTIGRETGRVSFIRLVGKPRDEGSRMPAEFDHVAIKGYAFANLLGLVHAAKAMQPYYDFDAFVEQKDPVLVAGDQDLLYQQQPYPCMVIRHTDQGTPLPEAALVPPGVDATLSAVQAQSEHNEMWCFGMGFAIKDKRFKSEDPLWSKAWVMAHRTYRELMSAKLEDAQRAEVFNKLITQGLLRIFFGNDPRVHADSEVRALIEMVAGELFNKFSSEQIRSFLEQYLALQAKHKQHEEVQDVVDVGAGQLPFDKEGCRDAVNMLATLVQDVWHEHVVQNGYQSINDPALYQQLRKTLLERLQEQGGKSKPLGQQNPSGVPAAS